MHISRIYTGQPLVQDRELTLEYPASRHLIQVLRLRPGAELTLFNGDGCNYLARLMTASKKATVVRVLSGSNPEPGSILEIHLCISISKGERMDFAIQKSVEIGVTGITPVFTRHSVVNLKGERLEKRQQHWRQVMIRPVNSPANAACRCSIRQRIWNNCLKLHRTD